MRTPNEQLDGLDSDLAAAGQMIESLHQQLAAKQAEVDALMLEYCPSEMSHEQLDTWAAHQRPSEWKTNDELRQQLADRDAEIQTIRNSPTMDAIRRVIETKLADENNELRQQVTLLRDAIEAELLGADYARRAMRKAFESTKEQ